MTSSCILIVLYIINTLSPQFFFFLRKLDILCAQMQRVIFWVLCDQNKRQILLKNFNDVACSSEWSNLWHWLIRRDIHISSYSSNIINAFLKTWILKWIFYNQSSTLKFIIRIIDHCTKKNEKRIILIKFKGVNLMFQKSKLIFQILMVPVWSSITYASK
jgi:hypothetical protein